MYTYLFLELQLSFLSFEMHLHELWLDFYTKRSLKDSAIESNDKIKSATGWPRENAMPTKDERS